MVSVVSYLFVVIITCRFDFPIVAMGEPDPCREPHHHKLPYPDAPQHGTTGTPNVYFISFTISNDTTLKIS